MEFDRFTMGVGDRFAHQGEAQLEAFIEAAKLGINISPVWNKSFREHKTIHSQPVTVRAEADLAVKNRGWKNKYWVDADHIGLKTVDLFMDTADFFTLDVADFIGLPADSNAIQSFVASHSDLTGSITIPGIDTPFTITTDNIKEIAEKYLHAVHEAGKIYRHIEDKKGPGTFITEVSMDETDSPQTPVELLIILAAIADEDIPVRTIAPKFTGRFNKGVDFVGDPVHFEKEFDQDVCVIAWAIQRFNLPKDLKLSVHSGSDKFSIYGPINRVIQKRGCGLHLKTAGTTWLEELTGLAEAGGEALEFAKLVYTKALERYDELAAPYATVIDIDPKALPTASEISAWSSAQYVAALEHEPSCPDLNLSFRQLLHVGYKIAAEQGETFTNLLKQHKQLIHRRVRDNILEKHIKRIFSPK
jgi:hypothetical protein